MNKIKTKRDKILTLVAGLLIYFTFTLFPLYFDRDSVIEFIGKALIYAVPLILFWFVFDRISIKFGKQFFISFIIPYSIWSEMQIDDLSGSGKAQPGEQLVIFLLIWLLAFVVAIGITFWIKFIKSKL